MKKLIINADDFGFTKKLNQGIINSYVNGILTSTSLMANGQAFEEAVKLSKQHPELSIGTHLALVDVKPVLAASSISSLVDGNGDFYPNFREFFKQYFLKRIKLDDIRRELTAQIEKILDSGIRVTHIDGHQHVHISHGIIDIVIELAKKYRIRWIRNSHDTLTPGNELAQKGLSFFAKRGKHKINNAGLQTSNFFLGTRYTGKMKKQDLIYMLKLLPNGISEIMCHPGEDDPELAARYGADWSSGWKEEQESLTSQDVKDLVKKEGIVLTNYGEL
jgi:hopanoid biosynthesis associated protein HpnK